MRIGINARFLLKDKMEGIGVFTFEICRRLAKLMPECQFYYYFDRNFDSSFVTEKNIIGRKIFPSARHPILWKWWFDYALPNQLKKDKIDVFFSTDGYCSLNTAIPQILTIHDIAFEYFSGYIPQSHAKYMQYYTPKFISKATKIITVSAFSKQDIIQKYKVSPEKIDVVYNAFFKEEPEEKPTIEKINNPYFLFVGAIHPRKNILNLIRAFELFKQNKNTNYKLVLVGRDAWQNNDLKQYINQSFVKKDIIWIQQVSRINLLELYKNAFALTYLSFFEGFGIPLVEAMEYAIPIIASNKSAIPEIAENTALYCEPDNIEQISVQMNLLVNDEKLYHQLKENALIRKKIFSWDKSAERIARIINAYRK